VYFLVMMTVFTAGLCFFGCLRCLDGLAVPRWVRGAIKLTRLAATISLDEHLSRNVGDYVTVDLLIKEGGKPVETDFDQGLIRFCVNGGGYHAAVHHLASKLSEVGDAITEVCSGGEYYPSATAEIPLQSAPSGLKVGDAVKLSNGIRARVTRTTESTITIDANAPLAGKQLEISLVLLDKKPKSSLSQFTAACGCFWGIELALQRTEGVVFTAVGYAQGSVESPGYEQVCAGTTGHAETVYSLYDPNLVSYSQLLDIVWARHDPTQRNQQGNDIGTQYRGGIYYHSEIQRQEAEQSMKREQTKYKAPLATELKPFTKFWLAEAVHQQYLSRETGQSASKRATDNIRCYG